MKSIPESLPDSLKNQQLSNHRISLEVQVQRYNEEEGYLKGKDCRSCKNKGYIMILDEGYKALKPCECQKQRETKVNVEKSGLQKMIQDYTFETFEAKTMWQRVIKESAQSFVSDQAHWFFIGGQVGAGKTHICTAIVNELLKQGKQALYMLWREEIVKLKSFVGDGKEYMKVIEPFKTKEVLYIDDLFKTEKGKSPSSTDITIAFEILNARYQDKDLITIISSEKIIKDLLVIDEAIGSRIFERTKGYCTQLNQNHNMNIRLREREKYE
jgi:DNA replication protein DnaC